MIINNRINYGKTFGAYGNGPTFAHESWPSGRAWVCDRLCWQAVPCSTPRGERVALKCRDVPRPDTTSRPRRARRVKGAARYLARRERSHAQTRPALAGGVSMASTHPLTRLVHRGTARPGATARQL